MTKRLFSAALLTLTCVFTLTFAGADAQATPADSADLEASTDLSVELEADAPTSCELTEDAPVEANSAFTCRLTCQVEYAVCQHGGAPNCTHHYNQCLAECSLLPG